MAVWEKSLFGLGGACDGGVRSLAIRAVNDGSSIIGVRFERIA